MLARFVPAMEMPEFVKQRPGVALACVALLTLMSMPIPVFALTPEEQAFASAYVDAVNSKSVAKQKALIHQESQACMNPLNQDFFDEVFSKAAKDKIPPDAKIQFSADVPAFMSQGSEFFKMPVKPNYQMQVDFNKSQYSSVTKSLPLFKQGNKFFEVISCPTEKGLAKFREVQIIKIKMADKAKNELAKLPKDLRAALEIELKKGLKISAIKLYRSKTSAELNDAVQLVETLQKEMNKNLADTTPR